MRSHPTVDLLVCDFDETITQNDSICELANLAYEKRAKIEECLNDNDQECPPPWSYFVELYFKEYKEHTKHWHEKHSENTLQSHYKMLESLKKVENTSIDRVEKYGCMKGVCYNDLIERGKSIKKRDDVLNVLKKFISKQQRPTENRCNNLFSEEPNSTFISGINSNNNNKRNLYILSTNWSKDLILGSLFELVIENKFDKKNIFSNDLIFNRNNNCTVGKLDRKVLCAHDKLEIFNQLKTRLKSNLSVYIGDSNTDLPCLLQANIGIVMGNNRSLTKYCIKYGIEIMEGLMNFKSFNIEGEKENRKLYRVQSWKEISDSGLLD